MFNANSVNLEKLYDFINEHKYLFTDSQLNALTVIYNALNDDYDNLSAELDTILAEFPLY